MIIYPAIDLRNGRVVRLQQGRADAETVYSNDPAQTAKQWQAEGAEWLHVVNLDGAFGNNTSANLREVARIISTIQIPVQFGGGLRDMANVEQAFESGVARVVIGTAAIENPTLVPDVIARFGAESVAVGIDAREGFVSTHGWQEQSQISALDLARQMCGLGVTRVIYTDIGRDGMLSGIDAAQIAQIGREVRVKMIASGGVASVRDVEALSAYHEIEGVIVGQALYQGKLSLREAIDAGKKNHPVS